VRRKAFLEAVVYISRVRLRNTESGKVEELAAADRPLGIYVCGITPYDTTHVGHAFTYVIFDVLIRALRARGLQVRYVQNVTDVDDDIIRTARQLKTTWDRLADKETALYQADMEALNVQAPDVFPRASKTVPRIIALVAQLLSRGNAYQRQGNVYFRVNSFESYGRLSKLSRAEMIPLSKERGADPEDPLKEDPLDFLLWQKSAPDAPSWPSPWSEGRPGWHIECSAMALEHIGNQVDIHGGGEDLVFPHHESEIAQSESVTGVRPFVRLWTHVGMVRYQAEKMSKSLGNLVMIRELLQRYEADAIRVMLLRHHYREGWDYREEDLRSAAEWTAGLRRAAPSFQAESSDPAEPVLTALENDLDTPQALRALEELVASKAPAAGSGARLLGLRLLSTGG
jgi:L-cysteine:1D-myo-inositol 2-amino-2-deoxy-alpha-D-glucopyranoside ligase